MTVAVDSKSTFLYLRIWVVSWTGLFLLFGLLGFSTSSLAIVSAKQSGTVSDVNIVFGEPRGIRSDEYMRSTPLDLGLLKSGKANFVTPLAYPNNSLIYPDPDSWIDYINAFDTTWPRLLPGLSISQEFAFSWWTPIWLALVFLPLLLVRMGARFIVATSITVLIVASPVNAWWSLGISSIIGFSAMSAYLYLGAISLKKNQWAVKFVFLIGSAYGLFKLITCYQPWVIVIAPVILFSTLVFSMEKHGWKRSIKNLISVLALFSLLTAVFIQNNLGALETLSSTLYPGERRSTGTQIPAAITWGAPHLQILNISPDIISSNPSELSSSFSILLFASLALFTMGVIKKRVFRFQVTALTIVMVWLAWITINLPQNFSSIPGVSLVRPERAAAVFGVISTLLFAFSTITKPANTKNFSHRVVLPVALVTAIVAGSFTFIGGQSLQENIPRLGFIRISVAVIAMFILIFLILSEQTRNLGLISISLFSVLIIAQVNPLQRSVEGLASGTVSETLSKMNTPVDIWASDSGTVDALFMANGITSLSGQQLIGPNLASWLEIDPNRIAESSWNRGASYVTFSWTEDDVAQITAPHGDVIHIGVNPCALKKYSESLKYITSSSNLGFDCLVKVYEFEQTGKLMNVYELKTG